ncbi:Alpha-tubulin N-acetyltransferase 1 [Podila humilis]|nr:Alpha-tubulin N-acetyltransferase 1 [Podila humilis]
MDFEFPLIPLLPLPITLVPASTFAALEDSKAQHQLQQAYVSTVSIGLSSAANTAPAETLSDHERLGAIVDALGEASAKAQELPTSITQRQRLAKNPTQRVYILRTGVENEEDQWLDQLQIGPAAIKEFKSQNSSQSQNHNGSSSEEEVEEKNSESEGSPTITSNSRSDEKGVYVAGMLKIGEKKLFIVDKAGTMHEQIACCVLDFYVDGSCQRRGYGKLLFDSMLQVEGVPPNQLAYDRPSPKLYQFLSKHFGLDRHLPQPNQFAIFEGYQLQDCGEYITVEDEPYSQSRSSHSKLSTDSLSSIASTEQQQRAIHTMPILHHHHQQQQQQQQQHAVDIPSSNDGKDRTGNNMVSTSNSSTTSSASTATGITNATNRRISSAFTSSISLASPSMTSHTSAQANGDLGGGVGRTSRLLASSIVFSDT